MAQSQAPPNGGEPSPPIPQILPSLTPAFVPLRAPLSLRAQRTPPPVEDYSKTPCAQWTRCIDAILHAERSGARLYLALLPADLRPLIDSMVRRSAWVHSGMLAPLADFPKGFLVAFLAAELHRYFVLRSGERLWLYNVHEYPKWCTKLFYCDRAASDPTRTKSIPGFFKSAVEFSDRDPLLLVTDLTEKVPVMRLVTLAGDAVHEWCGSLGDLGANFFEVQAGWIRNNSRLYNSRSPNLTFPFGNGKNEVCAPRWAWNNVWWVVYKASALDAEVLVLRPSEKRVEGYRVGDPHVLYRIEAQGEHDVVMMHNSTGQVLRLNMQAQTIDIFSMATGAPTHTDIAFPIPRVELFASDRSFYVISHDSRGISFIDLEHPQGGLKVVKFPGRCLDRHLCLINDVPKGVITVFVPGDVNQMILWFLDRNAGVRIDWPKRYIACMCLTDEAVVLSYSLPLTSPDGRELRHQEEDFHEWHVALLVPLPLRCSGPCPSEVDLDVVPHVTPRELLRSRRSKLAGVLTASGAHAHWPLFRMERVLPYSQPAGRNANPTSEPDPVPWQFPKAE